MRTLHTYFINRIGKQASEVMLCDSPAFDSDRVQANICKWSLCLSEK